MRLQARAPAPCVGACTHLIAHGLDLCHLAELREGGKVKVAHTQIPACTEHRGFSMCPKPWQHAAGCELAIHHTFSSLGAVQSSHPAASCALGEPLLGKLLHGPPAQRRPCHGCCRCDPAVRLHSTSSLAKRASLTLCAESSIGSKQGPSTNLLAQQITVLPCEQALTRSAGWSRWSPCSPQHPWCRGAWRQASA